MSNARFKRPELPRREPIRSWSGVFGSAQPAPSSSNGHAAKPATESVSRGVDVGYRVLDEYLRQGQTFARTIAGARPTGSSQNPGPQLSDQLARSTMDWLATWFDFMQGMGNGAPQRNVKPREVGAFDIEPPAPTARATHSEPTPTQRDQDGTTHTGRTLITLDVTSKQRTEVTVDLKPNSLTRKLSAQDLRAADPDAPRIAGIELEPQPDDERLLVKIAVPEDQPAAVYCGMIVDQATHLPRGSITLRIVASSKDSTQHGE
jgi:hypothetical protein